MDSASTAPLIAQAPPWLNRDNFPFDSRFMDIGGCRVHYIDEGPDTDEGHGPILLLHGNPTWSFLYRKIIASLRRTRRCLALDYPGFGLSVPGPGYTFTPAAHAEITAAFIERLDLREYTLGIHDWGGPIGIHAAGRDPGRCAGLLVLNSWAWPVNSIPKYEAFSSILGSGFGRFLVTELKLLTDYALPSLIRRGCLSADELRAYRGPFPTRASRLPIHLMIRAITEARRFLEVAELRLAMLRDRPALIIWGSQDPAFGKRELARWQEALPRARTIQLHEAGHFVPEDDPGAVAAAVTGLTWG